MMHINKRILCPILAAAAVLTGSAAYASGPEAVSSAEIAVVSPDYTGIPVNLAAPETAPEGVTFSADGTTVTIALPGTYRLSGSLAGQVIVDADGEVELILAGVSLQGHECLSVQSKDDVTLTLEPGAINLLLDGATDPNENASAVIWSKAPLTIGGEGVLTVKAGANNAIQSKDRLTVTGGELHIYSANHGLKSRGALTLSGGSVTIAADGDGLCAEDDRIAAGDVLVTGGMVTITSASRGIDAESAVTIAGGHVTIDSVDDGVRAIDIAQTGGELSITARGYTPEDATAEETIAGDGMDGDNITISGGTTAVTSAGDGIQALLDLSVSGGDISITSGGGGGNASSQSGGDMFGPPGFGGWSQSTTDTGPSAKGLKSDGNITITGGVMNLNTADDAIHGASLCSIEGGSIAIYASDDGIHCDDMLLITGGDIAVTDCFEGLEAFAIEIHGGNISVYAVNDGVNANGPEGWGWGGNTSVTDSVSGYDTTYYWQSDGWVNLVVTGNTGNMGDGMDSNGSLYVTGGHLTVSTPGTFMENGIDGGHNFYISGGEVMAGGASAMQPTPSSATDQCVAVVYTSGTAAGTLVTLSDSEGNELWSHTVANYFTCLIVSHPGMTQGNTYTVTYGTESTTLDFTSSNSISAGSGGWGGGFGGGRGGRGGRPF